MKTSSVLALSLALGASACVPSEEAVEPELRIGVEMPEVEETSGAALLLEDAAAEFGVPVDVLKSLAYVETRFEPAEGEVEFDGQPLPYGLFALRGEALELAARLVGLSLDTVTDDPEANARGAAALLSEYASQAGLTEADRAEPLLWGPALRRWGDFDADLQPGFEEDVLSLAREGLAAPLDDGSTLIIRRHGTAEQIATAKKGLRAANTLWRPSPNYNSRGGTRPEIVVIHTCEGAYAGCVSWLRNPRSGVSAHYVVKEDGSEVSALVDDSNRAYHVGARYRSRLNGGQLANRENVSTNTFSIGIEHAGRASQRTWSDGLINRSVALVRDITARNNIPRDRYHIVGHGMLQPESRVDPGPNWPWARYLAAINAGSTPPSNPPPSNPPPSNPPPSNPPPSTSALTVDNTTTGRFRASSNWDVSSWASARVGNDYRFRGASYESDPAEYKIAIPTAGRYEVYARVPGNGYNDRVPFIIHHRGGQAVVNRDTSRAGGTWVSLGAYEFDAVDDWLVQISCWTNGNGYIIADAIRFERR